MTRRQRIRFKKVSACYDHHERIIMEQDKKRKDMELSEIIKQQQEAEPGMFRYEEAESGRWNWWGMEEDATGMDDDLPSAAEDCARVKGSYEI